MSRSIDQLIKDINTLSPEERQQVRDALVNGTSAQESDAKVAAEHEVNRRLAEAGIIREAKRRARDRESFLRYQPVVIEGKPLSETIIEERP